MTRSIVRLPRLAAAIVAVSCCFLALAQEKKTPDDKWPRVTLTNPLAVAPGSAVTLTVRGFALSEATDLRVAGASGETKAVIKAKGKAASLTDANGRGGATHPYLLTLKAAQ